MCAIIGQGRLKLFRLGARTKMQFLAKWSPGVKQWSPGPLNPFGILIGETHYVVQIGRQLSVQFFSTTTNEQTKEQTNKSNFEVIFF